MIRAVKEGWWADGGLAWGLAWLGSGRQAGRLDKGNPPVEHLSPAAPLSLANPAVCPCPTMAPPAEVMESIY